MWHLLRECRVAHRVALLQMEKEYQRSEVEREKAKGQRRGNWCHILGSCFVDIVSRMQLGIRKQRHA